MRSTRLAGLALCAAMAQAPTPLFGATLRPMTTLGSGVVRLSDLFDDAGPEAATVLGPAPAPGERIVVEAAQLTAIARQFDVDWRPASPAARIVLERPGRALAREAVLASLRDALDGAGAPADSEVQLPGFSAPLVPLQAKPELSVEQIDYQGGAAGGHFTAQLGVAAAGMEPLHLRFSGTVQAMLTVPVPTHRLLPGAVLRPGDLAMRRVPAGLARGAVLQLAEQANGMEAGRVLMPGRPVPVADLRRPEAVSKGARVAMRLLAPGLLLLAQGEALEGGPVGAHIAVLNPASRAVLEAEVTGRNQVQVAPGSAPIAPPGAGGSLYYRGFAPQVAGR